MTALTYRQLDHWTSQGYLRPVNGGSPGSGRPRQWTGEELRVARTMAALRDAGLALPAAAAAARQLSGGAAGAGLAPGITVQVMVAATAMSTVNEEWAERALCAETDPEAFFPEGGDNGKAAKRVCRRCEVRAECLAYALEHGEEFGVWGGKDARQRRHLTLRGRAS